jgi:hypothetical protein
LWPSPGKWFIYKAVRKLKKINLSAAIDCIITVSMPYEAHLAGYKYKKYKKNVKWITYTLDSFVYNPTLQKHFVLKGFRNVINTASEEKIFRNADANFLPFSLKDTVNSSGEENKHKFHWISFPLITEYKQETTTDYFEKDTINVVYAGSFYKDIRNPEYCLRLFSLIDNSHIVLHLFHRGECGDIINHFSMKSRNIISHGNLPVEKIYEVEKQANILLNVGNTIGLFFPSKLLEYISFGKPIINVHDHRYSYKELLEKYPYVLNIENNSKNIEENAERIVRFCKENKENELAFSEIENLYRESTPEYILRLFEQVIDD